MADGGPRFTVIQGGLLTPAERLLRAFKIVEEADKELSAAGEHGGLPLIAFALATTMALKRGEEAMERVMLAAIANANAVPPTPPEVA